MGLYCVCCVCELRTTGQKSQSSRNDDGCGQRAKMTLSLHQFSRTSTHKHHLDSYLSQISDTSLEKLLGVENPQKKQPKWVRKLSLTAGRTGNTSVFSCPLNP